MDPHAVPKNSDQSRYKKTPLDLKLAAACGDHLHQNDGRQLDGGIADDRIWQTYHTELTTYHAHHYNLPKSLAKPFLTILAALINGTVDRAHNSEKFLVFPMVILQKQRNIRGGKAIRALIASRLESWTQGHHQMLVSCAISDMKAMMSSKRGHTTAEERLQTFQHLMQKGEIRKAIRFYSEREEAAGIHEPEFIHEPSGESTMDILETKHPKPAADLSATDLPDYPTLPVCPKLFATPDVVATVATHLKGAAGLGGTDGPTLKEWLIRYKTASLTLRTAVARLTTWLSNDIRPWAAIRALMSNRLIALDKNPGVRPIGIGQIWRRLMAKTVVSMAGHVATEVCGTDQLCVGLKSGIEGGIHAATQLWKEMADEPEFGALMLDAVNAFNELRRVLMIWVVRHEWAMGFHFVFNCYRHWARLVVHSSSGTLFVLYSMEGVTQGDPLAMILYGLTVVPLIRDLKKQFPELTHIWFADDGNAIGNFHLLDEFFNYVHKHGKPFGFQLDPRKCVLVTHPDNLARAQTLFGGLLNPDNIVTGHRFLGGFLGQTTDKDAWLAAKTDQWTHQIHCLSAACERFPQSAFCGMQKSLQMQWQFVQRVVECPPSAFAAVETAMADIFLPELFQCQPPDRALTALPFKFAGMSLPDASTTTSLNFNSSSGMVQELASHIKRPNSTSEPFTLENHQKAIRTTQKFHREQQQALNETLLRCFLQDKPKPHQRLITRGQTTGTWLSLCPTSAGQTLLSALEFRDGLCMRYGIEPPGLPSFCDGCGAPFSKEHAVQCRKGGLVIQRHNEIRDELGALCAAAFSASKVRNEPFIDLSPLLPSVGPAPPSAASDTNTQLDAAVAATSDLLPPTSPAVQLLSSTPPPSPVPAPDTTTFPEPPAPTAERGDLLVRGFFSRSTDTIFDIRVQDLDAASYVNKDPLKCLMASEQEKKQKYHNKCQEFRRTFVPFVVSVDGMFGPEAVNTMQRIAQRLSDKWQRPYSVTFAYVKSRFGIAVVRATNLCLRGARLKTHTFDDRRYLWDEEGLYRLHNQHF